MPPASLDAWQAYHRGLVHMYRFTGGGNREAQRFFLRAIALDPTFSRNYAGLSFTHFHNAFLLQSRDRDREIALAFETAGQALEADPGDPAAHWAMGRALWLRREHEGAISALNQSIRLSPSYALAHYGLAFVHCQTGIPHARWTRLTWQLISVRLIRCCSRYMGREHSRCCGSAGPRRPPNLPFVADSNRTPMFTHMQLPH